MRRGLALADPIDPEAVNQWITMLIRGEAKLREAGRSAEADALRAGCLDTLARLADSSPLDRIRAAVGYRRLGDMAIADGDRPRGFEWLRIAIRLAPNDPTTMNNLAWALLNAPDRSPEQLSEAIELAERADRLAPDEAAILNTLAVAYYRDGDLDRAEQALDRSIRLNQGEIPVDHFLLAMILHHRNDPEEARRQFEHGVELIELRGLERADPETVRFRDEAAALLEFEDDPERPKGISRSSDAGPMSSTIESRRKKASDCA
jgi:Flp pilus assembly protein TadD